jgi:hypothetical protein
MKLLKLTHANLKKDGRPVVVYVPPTSIGDWHFSPAHGCTHVYVTGPHVFPALESEEEIEKRYLSCLEHEASSGTKASRRGK